MAQPSSGSPRSAESLGDLPLELTRFIGRRRELALTRDALARSRLVTLTGIGGVGKTRLAMEVAGDVATDFDDVRVVHLADVLESALLGHTLNIALGVREHSARWQLTTVSESLRGRHVLLVMDNCEHLAEHVGPFIDELLRACAGLSVLATSRQPLGVKGEVVVQVPPLSVSPDAGPGAGSVTPSEAVSLFLDRAAAAIPGLEIGPAEHAHIAELCRLLDGIPLAIELAAVRLRLLPLRELVARTGDRFRLLNQGSRTAPLRHQTLRASIDGTYELCSAKERLAWARLSIFAGGFSLEAAEAVVSDADVPHDAVLDLVAGLMDKSIVTRVAYEGEPRYTMLETIRQYAVEHLDPAAARELSRRHREWFLTLAERADEEWSGPDQVAWLSRLRWDYANLRVALQTCLLDAPQQGMRMVWSIENFWLARGFLSEARLWLDQLLAVDRSPALDRGRALRLSAWLAILQGDHDAVPALLEEAQAIAEEVGDAILEAYVVQSRGLLAMFRGELQSSIDQLEVAVEEFIRIGYRTGVIHSMFELGIAYGFAGDGERAAGWQQRCQETAAAVGESWWRSFSLWAYGIDKWRQGDIAQAEKIERESLRLKREQDDQLGVGVCLEAMSWIAAAEGDAARSARLMGAADSLLRRVGMSIEGSYSMWDYHQSTAENLRTSWGEERLQRAYDQGAAWTAEDAVSFALGERDAGAPHGAHPLTPREREVADLVGAGQTNRQIAATLFISVRTAEKHVDRILSKLNLSNRSQLAAWTASRRADET
ncbi:helix-turn-helix transcriptional regulator [Nocardioides sp. AN3]